MSLRPGDEAARMSNFTALSRQEQAEAIRDLAGIGMGVSTLAHATGLSIEAIKRVLALEQGGAP